MPRLLSTVSALTLCLATAPAQDYTAPVAPNAAWRPEVGPLVAFEGARMRFEGPTVTGAPYSAEAVNEVVQTLPDGNRIHRESRSKVWRDGQGRTRREETLNGVGPWAASQEPKTLIFINDPVSGEHYVVDPQEKTVRRLPTPKLHLAEELAESAKTHQQVITVRGDVLKAVKQGDAERGPQSATFVFRGEHVVNGDLPKPESLGSRVIEGVTVEGTRITTTIPAGAIGNEREIVTTFERWSSPELGVDVKTVRQDPRQGEFTYRLENIQRTEPDPALFEPPADYKILEAPEVHEIRLKEED